MDEYYDAIAGLPDWLKQPLGRVPPGQAAGIHEIRLRRDGPVIFTVLGVQQPAAECCPGIPELGTLRIGGEQMDELLFSLCGGSVHSYEDELSDGYFTIAGGHRVGVGGHYVHASDGRITLQCVDSLNIRIARCRVCRVPVFLRQMLEEHFTGLLIAGEPDSGKTTFLRSILPILEAGRRSVAVIDERGEIFPDRLSGADGFARCDRITGLDKATAIQMALRTLGPQVILLDELGTLRETALLEQGFFSGVDFVATLHAANLAEAEQKPQVQFLLAHHMLHHICQLEGRRTPGQVKEGRDYCC